MNSGKGFTLLELIIALALVGVLTLLLFAGMRTASNAWDRTDDSAERSGTLRLVWQFLDNHLSQARPVEIDLPGEVEKRLVFSGFPASLEFVSHMTPSLGAGGVYILRMEIIEDRDSHKLQLARWLFHPEVIANGTPLPVWQPLSASDAGEVRADDPALNAYYTESVLLDTLEVLEIRYFGPVEDVEDPVGKNVEFSWQAQWEDREKLPWLVAISIHDGKDLWPEMVFGLPH